MAASIVPAGGMGRLMPYIPPAGFNTRGDVRGFTPELRSGFQKLPIDKGSKRHIIIIVTGNGIGYGNGSSPK